MFREKLLALTNEFCWLSDDQISKLEAHYELLIRWNRRLNLTRIEGEDDAAERHYAESLFLGSKLPEGELSIVDVGSGAGFPGIPVAVLRPECRITLLECHQRKAVFLKESVRSLSNVRVIAKRAEEVRDQFDWAISRAVSMRDLASYSTHLARRCAVLGTEWSNEVAGVSTASQSASVFSEPEVIAMPWGFRRKLVMFHVEHLLGGVSRETPCDRI
ncbi:MAG: 16S rRNA (guanine(527)-N(7))-methyltransferase RsmG [Bryobacteraceae bacterium]